MSNVDCFVAIEVDPVCEHGFVEALNCDFKVNLQFVNHSCLNLHPTPALKVILQKFTRFPLVILIAKHHLRIAMLKASLNSNVPPLHQVLLQGKVFVRISVWSLYYPFQ